MRETMSIYMKSTVQIPPPNQMKTGADVSNLSTRFSSGYEDQASAMRTSSSRSRGLVDALGRRPGNPQAGKMPQQFTLDEREAPQQVRLLTESSEDKLPNSEFSSPIYRRNDSTNSYFENLYSYFIQQQQLDALPHRHDSEVVGAVLLSVTRYLFALFIPAALIIIGVVFLGKCPSQPFMPYWQLAFGGLLLFILLTVIIYIATSLRESAHGACSTYCYYVSLILFVTTEFGWLVLGCVIYTKVFYSTTFDDKSKDSYCEPFFFYSLFWELAIAVFLVIFGLSDYFINILKKNCTKYFISR